MAKSRSPQYPVIGLEEAVSKVKLVWESDYVAELPREVIAEHMGYKSLNGKSLGVLAAVAKYGLLEGRGDKTHVTELAVQILAHETGDPKRSSAVLQASKMPDLFEEIRKKFNGQSPSNQALKSHLFTRGFTHSGVERVILSFRETELYVETEVIDLDKEKVSGEDGDSSANGELTGDIERVTPPHNAKGVPTIAMSDMGLEIGAGVISTIEQYERLLRRLKAGRVLLEEEEIHNLLS